MNISNLVWTFNLNISLPKNASKEDSPVFDLSISGYNQKDSGLPMITCIHFSRPLLLIKWNTQFFSLKV